MREVLADPRPQRKRADGQRVGGGYSGRVAEVGVDAPAQLLGCLQNGAARITAGPLPDHRPRVYPGMRDQRPGHFGMREKV